MSKVILNNVGSLIEATTAAATINSNNAIIQVAFDNTLSRDGTQPNTMNAPIDMNSKRILNLPQGESNSEPVTVATFNAAVIGHGNVPVGGTTGQVLAKNSSTDYDSHWINTLTSAVTSVGLALPADFTITGSPVTTTGTLTGAWAVTPTGTGAVVRATSPTLSNPTVNGNIGTGTINNVIINTPASTSTLALGSGVTATLPSTDTYVGRATTDTLTNKTIASATNTITGTQSGLTAGTVTTNANMTGDVLSSGSNVTTLKTIPGLTASGAGSATTTPIITWDANGRITSASAATVTPAVGSITGLGTNVSTFLATPTSANLASAVTNETGSGALVFATSPALVTPTGIVKGDVGLGNVDNTSDVTKWAATKTLTNTTYDTAGTGNSFSINSLAATANTGTGSVVRATSPTLVTPVLGAATATTINGVTLDNTAWTTYTPTVTSQAGTPTASATGRYKQIGKTVFCQVTVTVTLAGTATGFMAVTLPVNPITTAGAFYVGSSYESSVTGNSGFAAVLGAVSSTTMRMAQAAAVTWWVTGYIVSATVTYEVP